ncbi:MAG: NADH-quinone oxidoreductase subunit NuoI [Desulfuromonadaceae bacterium]|nr:NADH-quinone oxidoreductase subunit NuoI [Desulfuromonadaceae bacterium]MDD5106616.1 NADH-quinone oxidoreductase subunit NuoI [Desulfuromonadaceae bacterium]
MKIVSDITAIMTGMWITWKHIFRRPVTIQYPEQKRTPYPRYRARIVLTRDPDGGERCVACQLCSAACPVDCISMQAAEGVGGRRYAEWFRINFSRCIFCGLCAEACPTLAIQMTPDFEICERDIMALVYEKEHLLIDGCGKSSEYNYYRHAGIGVTQPRGTGNEERLPVDVRGLLP